MPVMTERRNGRSRWRAWRMRRRGDVLNPAHLLSRIPTTMIEYPLEVFLATYSLLTGVPVLLGWTTPPSVLELLPGVGSVLWGLALTAGGATVAVGLRRREYTTTVPSGLWLLSGGFLAYCIAAFTRSGLARGWGFGMFLATGVLLSATRAVYLVLLGREHRRIATAQRETEELLRRAER